MQSTPSRARHSNNMRAPLIRFDMSFASKKIVYNKKGHQPVSWNPADGLGTFFRCSLSGAGYDDQGNNNNAYRNTVGVGERGPACKNVGHRTEIRVYLRSFVN